MKNWWRYTVKYEIKKLWELRLVWWIIKLIPRGVKKWIVVQSAVKAHATSDKTPDQITYAEMHDVWVKR